MTMAACGDNMTWGESVDSLRSLCVSYLAHHLEVFCYYDLQHDYWNLRPAVYLPPQISEDLLYALQRNNVELSDGVLHIFSDKMNTPLRRVRLDSSDVTDLGVSWLLDHDLSEVDLSWGKDLTEKTFLLLQKHSRNLSRLALRNASSLLKYDLLVGLSENPDFFMFVADIGAFDPVTKKELTSKLQQEGAVMPSIESPRLRALTIQGLSLTRHSTSEFLECFCKPLTALTYLDISHCSVLVDSLTWLKELRHLVVLILHSVPIRNLQTAVENICEVKSLRTLDLSTAHRNSHLFPHGDRQLRYLLTHLPELRGIDLSGTNLAIQVNAGAGGGDGQPMMSEPNCGIQGFEGFHLEFIGLLSCPGFEFPPKHIPAKLVTGSWGVEPLLMAGKVYADRKGMVAVLLPSILMSLRTLQYTEQHYKEVLELVMTAMRQYLNSFTIAHYSILCVAQLPIRTAGQATWLRPSLKKRVITTILDLMECHWNKSQWTKAELMRKCCCTLTYFDLPSDLLFVYKQVVTIMMSLVTVETVSMGNRTLVQTALYILRFMSSQVDVSFKEIAGSSGCIKKMLLIINRTVGPDREGDVILLRAWSILWSLTDVSPANCERFLEFGGLATFMECLQCLGSDTPLISKMVGMLRNVVEVPSLIPELATKEYLTIFSEMLTDEMNISINACSILALIVASGATSSILIEPEIDINLLIKNMTAAIMSWDINARRNVRYRSLQPMLQLLGPDSVPVSTHWAVWELANMIHKDENRYFPMLEREGGVTLLQQLVSDPHPCTPVQELGTNTLARYHKWKNASLI